MKTRFNEPNLFFTSRKYFKKYFGRRSEIQRTDNKHNEN